MQSSKKELAVRIVLPKSQGAKKYLATFPDGFMSQNGKPNPGSEVRVKKITTLPSSSATQESSSPHHLRKRNLAYYGGMTNAAYEANKPISRYHATETIKASGQSGKPSVVKNYEAPALPSAGKYVYIYKEGDELFLIPLEDKLMFKKVVPVTKAAPGEIMADPNEQAIRDTYDMMVSGRRKESKLQPKPAVSDPKKAKDGSKSKTGVSKVVSELDTSDNSSKDSLEDLVNDRSDHSDNLLDDGDEDGLFSRLDSQNSGSGGLKKSEGVGSESKTAVGVGPKEQWDDAKYGEDDYSDADPDEAD